MMASEKSTPELPVLDKKNDDGIESEVSKVSSPSHGARGERIVTRKELWSYYLYYNGGSGVPVYAALFVFQELATLAGYDPVRGPGSSCIGTQASGKCVLPWGNGTKAVNSIVLLSSGISFAMITIILSVLGPAADYGSLGRWPLLLTSLIYWAIMFSTITLTTPSHWAAAMGIYTVGSIAWGVAVAFYAAVFPSLARNRGHIRELKERRDQGEITTNEYIQAEALEKSRISSFSIGHGAIGYVIILLFELPMLFILQGNSKVNNYVIMMATAYGVLLGIWWFIFEQPRPGPRLPEGEHYYTIGWKQIWIALKQWKKLPNTLTFLFAYFLLADGLNTTTTLVRICQNAHFTFSFKQNAYLGIVEGSTSIVSILGFWYVQRYWKIDSKKMLVATNVVAIILPLWGMIGIWTNKFGYHNNWEFWAYNAAFGFFQAPYYSYSQTVMAELTPPGFSYMFFGLFGMVNRASSIVGPNVVQAIINRTGNTWEGFSFLFAICFASSLIIWFVVDVGKGRRDAERWAVEKRGTATAIYFGPE